jgi:Fe2+ transport system protein B
LATKSNDIKLVYKRTSKLVQKQTKRDTIEYEKKLIRDAKHQPKILYSYINQKQTQKEAIKALQSDNLICTDKKQIANILNNHFHSIFSQDSDREIPPIHSRTTEIYDLTKDIFSYELNLN